MLKHIYSLTYFSKVYLKIGITRNIYKKPTKLSDILESQFSFDNMRFKQKYKFSLFLLFESVNKFQ